MATIIVNPTASSNGVGSTVDPKNTWDGMTWTPGNTYLQVAGTTWLGTDATSAINVTTGGTAADRITLGSCDPNTFAQITDGSRRAVIDANGVARGINFGNLIAYATVESLEITNAALRGILKGTSANSASANGYVYVRNCYVHDIGDGANESYAINMYGVGNEVTGNLILDCGRVGIFCTANDLLIDGNTVDRIGLEQLGDCIQLTGSANPIIVNNRLTKTNVEKAICIVGAGCSGGRFQGNMCYGPTWQSGGSFPLKGLNTEAAGMAVVNNVFDCGAEYVVFVNAVGVRVMGNLILSRASAAVAGVALVGSDSLAVNNTIIGIGRGARGVSVASDAYTGVSLYNNIITGFARGLRTGSGTTENYNCLYDNTDASVDLADAAKSLGAQSITSDPLLDASYRPREGSPLIGAATYIAGARHMNGKRMSVINPTIGAYGCEQGRNIAATRAVAG